MIWSIRNRSLECSHFIFGPCEAWSLTFSHESLSVQALCWLSSMQRYTLYLFNGLSRLRENKLKLVGLEEEAVGEMVNAVGCSIILYNFH